MGGVLLLDLVIDLPDVGLLLLAVRQLAEPLLHLRELAAGDLRDGVDPFDGADEFLVAAQVRTPAEYGHRKDEDVCQRISLFENPFLTQESASSLSLRSGEGGRQGQQDAPFFISRKKLSLSGLRIRSVGLPDKDTDFLWI